MPDKKGGYHRIFTTNQEFHSMDKISFFDHVTLWWVVRILKIGWRRPLEHADLLQLRDQDRCEQVTERLNDRWEDEKTKARRRKRRPSLWKAMLRFFTWKEYALIVVTGLSRVCGRNIAIYSLITMIYVLGSDANSKLFGWKFSVTCCGVVFGMLVKIIAVHHFHISASRPAIRFRAAALGLVYSKILKLPQALINPGYVMELISDDSQTLVTTSEWLLPDAINVAMESLTIFGLLAYFVGWQAVLVSMFFIGVGISRLFFVKLEYRLRNEAYRFADQRLGYLRQILAAIRSIKLNNWESLLEEKVTNVRGQEVLKRGKLFVILALSAILTFISKSVVSFVTILLLQFTTDITVTSEMIIALLVCITVIKNCLGHDVPIAIAFQTKFASALVRIQSFLEICEKLPSVSQSPQTLPKNRTKRLNGADKSPEKATDACDYGSKKTIGSPDVLETTSEIIEHGSYSVYMYLTNVSSKLPVRSEIAQENILSNITITASKPGLIFVVGPVGCGKSSLLSCVLSGELVVSSGTVKCSGKRAFVSQIPWVLPGTIRENILFGSAFDEERYWKVVEACQLKMDLKSFPEGDLSLIGEHGSTISGGQRTRVSLARAVYSQADIYLLDDPLNSLDAKVAVNVFQQCLRGMLADRIVIMTTHHLQHIKDDDYVVQLDKGAVIAQGVASSMRESISTLKVSSEHKIVPASQDLNSARDKTSEVMDEDQPHGEALRQEKEDQESGSIPMTIYWKYFRNGLPAPLLILLAISVVLGQGLRVLVDVISFSLAHLSKNDPRVNGVVTWYSVTFACAFLAGSLSAAGFYFLCLNAARVVHNKMLHRILKAPLSFHALNPVGRIMNRFSQDIGSLDFGLPVFSSIFVLSFLEIPSTLVFLAINNPILIPLMVALLVLFYFATKFYSCSAMDLKRHMSIACGPLYSHFSNTVDGIKCIRVYKKEPMFLNTLYRLTDAHSQTLFAYYPAVRWFSMIIDLTNLIFLTCVLVIVALTVSKYSNQDLLYLGVYYAFGLLGLVQHNLRMIAETHAVMTSAERALAYTRIEPEKGSDVTSRPPENWPDQGNIHFRDVSLRYYENGPKALINLTFDINASEKVGIVGRTGAGKSSLAVAIMRLCESDGKIVIDGIDNKQLNLQQLRSSISVISQSPVLLSGPLRESLDPHSEYTDSEIWDALGHVQMKQAVASLPHQLSTLVMGTGTNFSVGERQLLHLARILLRKNKILILDEATSSVDLKSDTVIQSIIQKEFKDRTVITIAHRIDSILKCDRVMLLDHGKILEYDDPNVLLEKQDGLFRKFFKAWTGN